MNQSSWKKFQFVVFTTSALTEKESSYESIGNSVAGGDSNNPTKRNKYVSDMPKAVAKFGFALTDFRNYRHFTIAEPVKRMQ